MRFSHEVVGVKDVFFLNTILRSINMSQLLFNCCHVFFVKANNRIILMIHFWSVVDHIPGAGGSCSVSIVFCSYMLE